MAVSEHSIAGEIRDGRHILPVRVYYEDTDFSGSVYHASYLRFMERGRTDYLRLLGTDQRALFEQTEKEAPGFSFVVRSMQIDFFKPARFSDLLQIVTAAGGGEGRLGPAASAGDARGANAGGSHSAGRLCFRRPRQADSEAVAAGHAGGTSAVR